MMAQSISDQHLSDLVASHAHQNFVRLFVGETVGEALARVQTSGVEGRIIYFYVVDQQDRLQGVIPTRRLLLNPPETPIADIMVRQVVALPATATLLDACEFFVLHRFLALPVVDGQRRIVGVLDVELYTDEISDLVRREENENVFQLIGVRLGRAPQASVATAFRGRFPWLLCNIGGGLACAAVAALFQHVMADVIVLAMFIPVVLALAESVSIQSLTLAIQAHDSGRFQGRSILRRLRREATIGLALGLACGGLVGMAAIAWHRAALLALVILVSIALSITTATVFGLSVPLALRAARRDPRVASGPIALAMTDVATLIYYLGLATMLLG
jgi:magnesium transporter